MKIKSYSGYGSQTRYRDLKVQLRRVRANEVLSTSALITSKIFFRNDSKINKLHPATINQWQQAFVSLVSIIESDDDRKRGMNDYRLSRLVNIYNNFHEQVDSLDNQSSTGQEFLIRLSNSQLPLQMTSSISIGRALRMFVDIPAKLSSADLDIRAEIVTEYGMDLEEMLTVAISLLICSSDEGYIDEDMLTDSSYQPVRKMLEDGRMGKVREFLTADYDEIRQNYQNNMWRKGLEHYIDNYLRKKPIVRTRNGRAAVPVAHYLVERLSSGVFYTLMDKHRTASGNAFLTFFGKNIFEEYVGDILKMFVPNKDLLPEFQYDNGSKDSSDWTIINGDQCLLIECKTSGITQKSKSYGDYSKVKADIVMRVVHGIKQMVKFRNNVRAGEVGHRRLSKVRDFHFIICTYDEIYFANAPFMRDIIEKELTSSGVQIDFGYDIVSVRELEQMHAIGKKHSINELIRKKHTKKVWLDMDFEGYLKNSLTSDELKLLALSNPLLRNRWEQYYKNIQNNGKA